MNYEQADEIIQSVLTRHGISIGQSELDWIAFWLVEASQKASSYYSIVKYESNEFEKRAQRAEALEKVIELYKRLKEEGYERQVIVKGCKYQSVTDWYIYEHTGMDLDKIIEGIKKLAHAENELLQLRPSDKMPASRPESAKNAAAKKICSILIKNKISIWKSCEIIAEMLIKAGIENKDQDKVKRALYDKLQRADLHQ